MGRQARTRKVDTLAAQDAANIAGINGSATLNSPEGAIMPENTVVEESNGLTGTEEAQGTGEVSPAIVDALEETPETADDSETAPEEDAPIEFIFTETQQEKYTDLQSKLAEAQREYTIHKDTVKSTRELIEIKKDRKEKDRLKQRLVTAENDANKAKVRVDKANDAIKKLEDAGRAAKLKAEKPKAGAIIKAGAEPMALTEEQKSTLSNLETELEGIINDINIKGWRFASILAQIRDQKLYIGYGTNLSDGMNAYMKERWGIEPQRKTRNLQWYDNTMKMLESPLDPANPEGPKLERYPMTEGVNRELSRAGDADKRIEVWREILKRSDAIAEKTGKPHNIEMAFVRAVIDEVVFGKNPNGDADAIAKRNEAIQADPTVTEIKMRLLHPLMLIEVFAGPGSHTYECLSKMSAGAARPVFKAKIDGVESKQVYTKKQDAINELELFAEKVNVVEPTTADKMVSTGQLAIPDAEAGGPWFFVGVVDGMVETSQFDTKEDPEGQQWGYSELYGPFYTIEAADDKATELKEKNQEPTF